MIRLVRVTFLLGMLSGLTCGAQAGAIVSISTPRDVQQAFILIKPDHPVPSVILFAATVL